MLDFMLTFWWDPIVKKPVKYGLLKSCKADSEEGAANSPFNKNVNNIIDLLEATITQKTHFPDSHPLKSYIQSKAYFSHDCSTTVDKYLNELLDIEVPKKEEVVKVCEEQVCSTAVCMPLKSVKVICATALKSVDKFDENQFAFTKALTRIEEFIKEDKIFVPKPGIYRKICGEEEKSAEERHYVVLQDWQLPAMDGRPTKFEGWQKLMAHLLGQVTLEPYFNLCCYADDQHPERSVMEDFLIRLTQYPNLFFTPKSKPTSVELLTTNLKKATSNGAAITEDSIINTITACTNALKQSKKGSNKHYSYINGMIASIKNCTRKVKKAIQQYTGEVIPLVEAERLVNNKELLKFSIDKVEIVVPANKVSDKASLIAIGVDEFSNEPAFMYSSE